MIEEEQRKNIEIAAIEMCIYFLKEKLKNKGLLIEAGNQQILDKKSKAGIYKGLQIAIQELKKFSKRMKE